MKGLNVQSCVSCGAYTLDQLTLERLLGSGGSTPWGATPDPTPYQTPGGPVYAGAPTIPAPPPSPPALPGELPPPMPSQQVPVYRPGAPSPSQPGVTPAPALSNPPQGGPVSHPGSVVFSQDQGEAERAARQSRTTMVLALMVLALLFAGVAGVGLVLIQGLAVSPPPPDTVPPTDLDEVLANDPPDDGSADAEQPEPEPSGQVTAEPAEPEPEPQIDPVRAHVKRGWTLVESDPGAAASAFQQAMSIRPADAEANYGYGYVLIKQGNTVGAQPHLCTAMTGKDIEVRRDVNSLLKQHQLTCD